MTDAEVGVEVDEVPALVAQLATGGPGAGHDDHAQGGGARDGEQHARIVERDVDDRAPQPQRAVRCVAEQDEADVGQHEGERREAHDAVDARQPVLPEGLLDERHARHEEDLQEQQVTGEQPGESAGLREDAGGRRHAGDAVVHHPQGDDENPQPPRCADRDVAPPGGDGARRRRHRARARTGRGSLGCRGSKSGHATDCAPRTHRRRMRRLWRSCEGFAALTAGSPQPLSCRETTDGSSCDGSRPSPRVMSYASAWLRRSSDRPRRTGRGRGQPEP